MSEEELKKDAWQSYMARHTAIRDMYLPQMLNKHGAADATTHLLLNALLLLNGGGLAAIPALKAIVQPGDFKLESLATSGAFFFGGLVLAVASGLCAIINFRKAAENLDAVMGATLMAEQERYHARLAFVPSANLKRETEIANSLGHRALPWSYWLGWGAGLLSGMCFAIGGATLGGSYNPFCKALGRLCITAT
jgi:hypothetical protein